MTSRFGHWRPFVWGALLAALGPGFLAGAALVAAVPLGAPLGPWWPAVAQAHGHAQLAGFAGLMVFGIAFHFLPRLRGAPLAAPGPVPWVLALYGGGLFLRVLAQVLGPLLPPAVPLVAPLRLLFALSGPVTLSGALAGLGVLVRTGLRGPPLRTRAGFLQVAPVLAAGGTAFPPLPRPERPGHRAGRRERPLGRRPCPRCPRRPAGLPGLARPRRRRLLRPQLPALPLDTPTPQTCLWGSLALLLLGLAVSLTAGAAQEAAAGAVIGPLLEGIALLWLVVALHVLAPRVTPAGRQTDAAETRLARATRWPLIGAYVWLTVAGLLLLLQGLLPLAGGASPPEDAVRHALGAGYVFLLVVGMGLRLIPGFAGRRARDVDRRWAWTAIGAAHAAALLRVLPLLALWLGAGGGRLTSLSLSLAGLAGVLAVLAFGAALRPALMGPTGLTGRKRSPSRCSRMRERRRTGGPATGSPVSGLKTPS